jgi:hypothetical protein
LCLYPTNFVTRGRIARLGRVAPPCLGRNSARPSRRDDSVYADTIGRFRFVPPNPPVASEKAAVAALTETITVQARAFDDAARAELFANLVRNRHTGFKQGEYVFLPAAKDAAADPAAGPATHKMAKRFVDEWGLAVD